MQKFAWGMAGVHCSAEEDPWVKNSKYVLSSYSSAATSYLLGALYLVETCESAGNKEVLLKEENSLLEASSEKPELSWWPLNLHSFRYWICSTSYYLSMIKQLLISRNSFQNFKCKWMFLIDGKFLKSRGYSLSPLRLTEMIYYLRDFTFHNYNDNIQIIWSDIISDQIIWILF